MSIGGLSNNRGYRPSNRNHTSNLTQLGWGRGHQPNMRTYDGPCRAEDCPALQCVGLKKFDGERV